MRAWAIALLMLAGPRLVRAGGFEIVEHSPQGVATVGAQTAVAEDASAVFYNPAGMTFQPGFGALAGGQLAQVNSNVDAVGQRVEPSHTAVAPVLFVTQRLGKHFAVGVGSFANFAEHFKYPADFSGRFLGTFVDVTTATINPSMAWRPIKQLSFGAGLDVVIGSLDIYQQVNFGGGEGTAHAGLQGVGVGGNAGLMVEAVPKYLRFGFSYRSRVDIDFKGLASLSTPPELQGRAAGLYDATTRVPFPHNFTFAVSSRPIDQLTLSFDLRYTLWNDLSVLTLSQTIADMPERNIENTLVLNLRNSWGVRGGAEYRVLDHKLRFRIGLGWDQTPVPRATLGPLLPDTDRVLVGGGLGFYHKWFSLEGAYLAAILLESTSENPDFQATYSTTGHVVSLAAALRFGTLGGRLAVYEQVWSDGPNLPPPKPPEEKKRASAR
jgi:long-chain fatty acid transport protein